MAKKKEEGRPLDAIQYEDAPKKSYVPDGFESVDKFLEDMRDEYEKDLEFDRDNRREAVDDKRFAAGEQWDPTVLELRQGLPCLTINTVPQFIAQLVGDWRDNRNAIKVVPSEDGDKEVASIRSDLIRAIEMKSKASRVYDSAFESTVQCGDGAFRVSVEYAKGDVFDQEIFIRPIDDALAVVWDRMSVDPTGRDARHVFVDDTIPMKEFKRKWPEDDPSELNDEMYATLMRGNWCTPTEARVTEYWRIIERDRLLAMFQDGSIHMLDGATVEDLIAQHGPIQRTRVAPCSYAQMHLVTGWKILSGPYEYKLNRVPIIRMTGRTVNIAGRRVRYGLVRFMKDPVRLRNFWRSVAAEQLGYAPKAQWIASESAVEGREQEFRNAHMSRDPLLIHNDGADPPQRVEPPALQMALLNEAQVNTQDMKDVTGIHDASLGIRSNETSGKAIMARQREGDLANLTYHDNGNAAILEGGDVVNQLIPVIYDAIRIVRTIGEDEEVKLLKINDPMDPKSPDLSTGNYDVALTTGTSYTTRRVEAAQAMMEAIQVYPELMQIAGDIVVKAQDWPGADKLGERILKTIPPQLLNPEEQEAQGQQQQPQAPSPEEQQMFMEEFQKMQEELQKISLENQSLKADKTIDYEKLKIDQYKAETDRIKALSDHEVDANQMEQDAIAKILDYKRTEDDREHTREQAELDRQHQQKVAKAKPTPNGKS